MWGCEHRSFLQQSAQQPMMEPPSGRAQKSIVLCDTVPEASAKVASGLLGLLGMLAQMCAGVGEADVRSAAR